MRASQDIKKAEEFNSLRDSIKKRIDDLDNFFEDNFDEEFITYFERGRYKLKKLIQYEPNLINEIDNGNNMKAFILGQNSKDQILEQDSDINDINMNNYMKKNKNNSKSCKIFPENNIMKSKYDNEFLNRYINKSNVNSIKNFKNNDKNYKWQKDIKNRFYNNYYNNDIRKKYSNMNSEDSNGNLKENKVKYMDWTEHNSIQGNTISIKSNKYSNSTYSNFGIKKKINNPKINNFVQNVKSKKKIHNEELLDMNLIDESDRTKSSKSNKLKTDTDNIGITNINNEINSREILFEIKLTKEEYNMLLKQKTKGKKGK